MIIDAIKRPMKIVFTALVALICTLSFAHAEGTPIPADSKSEWDFRGKASPFFAGSATARKLPECKTYEELRDTLEKAIPELIKSRC